MVSEEVPISVDRMFGRSENIRCDPLFIVALDTLYTPTLLTMGDWVYWLSWMLALSLGAGAAYLAWWSLFHDQAGDRRRCPRCWYNLTYAPQPGMTCSECGFTATDEKQLRRTRRRYGHLLLALLVIAGIAFFAQEHRGHRGWAATLPSHVLITLLPYVERPSSIYGEMSERVSMNLLTESQWTALMKRCARGDARARPTDEAWRHKYGTMIWHSRRMIAPPGASRFRDVPVDDDYTEPERVLLTIPPLITATPTRKVWPMHETAWVSMRIYDWWPRTSEVRLEITPLVEHANPRVIRYTGGLPNVGSIAFPLIPVESHEQQEMPFEVSMSHRRGLFQDWVPIGTQRYAVSIRAAMEDEVLLEPVGDEFQQLSAAVSRVFEGEVVRWPSGPSPVRFRYSPYASWEVGLEGIGIGAAIELRRDDAVARRLEMWWLAGSTIPDPDLDPEYAMASRAVRWQVVHEDFDLLRELDADDERWYVHIVGDPSIAIRIPGAERYWAGELVLPVRIAEYQGEAPPPSMWVE